MIWIALLAGCLRADEPTWGLVTDPFGDAMLLSAWSDGDEALIVGGDLHGGPATLVRYADGVPCVDASPAERALWWIHGPGPGEWYAVGAEGTVVHDVGGERTREDLDTNATLFGVWAAGDVVWAVGGDPTSGEGEIWRRTDGAWAPFATDLPGMVFKVWDDWFVGDGVAWRLEDGVLVAHYAPVDRLTTVRGRADDDVWAVGGVGDVVRWDGAAWAEVTHPFDGVPLTGVWTAPGEPVWVTGAFGAQGAWVDGAWDVPETPLTGETFHAVWPHGDDVLFVGGNFFASGANHGVIAVHGAPRDPIAPEACP